MNLKRSKKICFTLLIVLVCTPILIGAEGFNSIAEKQEAAVKESQTLNNDLSQVLTKVNEKYAEIEQLKSKVTSAKEKLSEYKKEIIQAKKDIAVRQELVNKQMRELQLTNTSDSLIELILSSESISELISRSFAITTLRNAQTEKVSSLKSAKEKLESLQKKQSQTIDKMVKDQEDLTTQAGDLQTQVQSLKTQVAKNQATLQQLATAKLIKEEEVVNEKVRKASKKKIVTASQEKGKEEKKPTAPQQPVTTGNGRVLTVQATGYSIQEAGMGYITATGIDLRKNPQCIAVDPSLIKLGSLVEVPGYGVAIAGDTGGVIHGNIIDLHFTTVKQALNWGRRTVTIKVLS